MAWFLQQVNCTREQRQREAPRLRPLPTHEPQHGGRVYILIQMEKQTFHKIPRVSRDGQRVGSDTDVLLKSSPHLLETRSETVTREVTMCGRGVLQNDTGRKVAGQRR